MGKVVIIIKVRRKNFVFNNYKEACSFIERDFKREKESDIKADYSIDEKVTVCEEGYAVLGTIYPSDIDVQTVTWQVAKMIDKR